MKIYEVGGCVRDRLLGLEPKDIDYVVVGATPQQMLDLGYKQVGASFPVFLHPITGFEYALARKERKVGTGYQGFECEFDPSVTLEDDLFRRDCTINALAQDTDTGEIIDPFNGQADLRAGILRHVSEHFSEDPLRILRVARFVARYNYQVADETIKLMKDLVSNGEVHHLTPERTWIETTKAITERYPHAYFHILNDVGALFVLYPELVMYKSLDLLEFVYKTQRLPYLSSTERFATLTLSFPSPHDCEAFYARIKAPNEVITIALKANMLLHKIVNTSLSNETLVNLFESLGAYRDQTLLEKLLLTLDCAQLTSPEQHLAVLLAFNTTKNISFASLSPAEQATLEGKEISQAIKQLRINTLNIKPA